METNVLLGEATIQQIQLELIRRVRFNECDGPKIADSLERHRDLWLAATMMRFGLHDAKHPDWFPSMSLIAVRDLRHDVWNVDTLIVLTRDADHARRLERIAEEEVWDADELSVQEDAEELGGALGHYPCPFALLTAWWD